MRGRVNAIRTFKGLVADLRSIRIFEEDNQYYVVKNRPQFIREVIRNMSLCNDTIKLENQSNCFNYKLDVNDDVLSFLHSVFKLIELPK